MWKCLNLLCVLKLEERVQRNKTELELLGIINKSCRILWPYLRMMQWSCQTLRILLLVPSISSYMGIDLLKNRDVIWPLIPRKLQFRSFKLRRHVQKSLIRMSENLKGKRERGAIEKPPEG
ncbi:hypothetical protein Tco_0872295 [Tanacetum coccineum]